MNIYCCLVWFLCGTHTKEEAAVWSHQTNEIHAVYVDLVYVIASCQYNSFNSCLKSQIVHPDIIRISMAKYFFNCNSISTIVPLVIHTQALMRHFTYNTAQFKLNTLMQVTREICKILTSSMHQCTVALRCNVALACHSFAGFSKLVTLFSTIECMSMQKFCESCALSRVTYHLTQIQIHQTYSRAQLSH